MRMGIMAPPEEQGEEAADMAPAASEPQQETQEQDHIEPSSSKAEQGEEDAETALASSQEEQDEEGAKIAPAAAASEKQKETEKRYQMAPEAEASKEEEEEKEKDKDKVVKIDDVLWLLEPLQSKITALLEASGPRNVRDLPERRALEFMNMELTDIVDSMNSMRPPLRDDRVDVGLQLILIWPDILIPLERDARRLIKQVADSQLPTLLRRATRFFRRSNKVLLYTMMQESFRAAEYARKFRCLLLAIGSSDHAPPPCPDLPLFGIDRPTKKLLRWLMPREETEKKLRFMAIVGPAGMGKTTLAMELHRRLECQASRGHDSFQHNVVAQVSHSTHRMELLLWNILSPNSDCPAPALSSDQSRSKTKELVVRVQEYLQDKRYFILIDDLWNKGDWEEIKGAFPNNNLDSRLLITTRVESVAWSCCFDPDSDDVLVHEMKPLNQMDSQRLLLEKAFGSVDGCPSDRMKLFCDKILMRCQGIPLFITGMADWLKEQLEQQHEEEEEHQKFAINSEEEVPQLPERFEQLLSSAFDDLPPRLTTLFLCMSMLPYWYSFEKDHLILKWLSECHTSSLETLTIDILEKVGEQYFSQLIDRNVITGVAEYCKPEACQWHANQFMLQFLASKSAEIGFAFTSTTLNLVVATATGHGNVTRIPRRLALHHPDPLLPSVFQTMDLSRTRWLTVSGAVSGIPLDKFVNLVVLDLEGWYNLSNEDLEHICRGKMFVLEYLSIRTTRVSKLPDEIKELQNLMILDVSRTQISVLPFGVFKLKRLYHLDLRGTGIGHLPKEIVGLQSTLHTLLVGDEGMINSNEAATRVPQDIQHFHALHTLATIDLNGRPASFIKALGDLVRLKVLAITWSFHQCTDKAYCKALVSSLKNLKDCLKSLTIHCGLGCSMDFLGVLSGDSLHRLDKLEKFKVTAGRFARVPKLVDRLLGLSFVQITICMLGNDDLRSLGELQDLRCLILGLDFIPEGAIVIENVGFRELQRFSVDCQMPWLAFRTGAMRKLRYLQLKLCTCPASGQTSAPSGIDSLRSLSEVALCYNARYIRSPNVQATVEAVRKEVAEHPNQIDLFINGHQDYDVQAPDEEIENATGTQRRVDAECDAQAVTEEAGRTTAEGQSEIEAEAEARSDS